MKKIALLGLLLVFLPAMISAQDKIEAPVWNVGDRWTFTGDGSIEVIKADKSGYILKFSERTCSFESQGSSKIFFDKLTRNRIHAVDGDKPKKYRMALMKNLDFPLSNGKKWKWSYSGTVQGMAGPVAVDISEDYRGLGWENIEVRAGKFRALKLEYKRKGSHPTWVGQEVINLYWYSPDAKYFVKCLYDKDWMKGEKDVFNWELTSLQLKK